jgi:hypothetical protein
MNQFYLLAALYMLFSVSAFSQGSSKPGIPVLKLEEMIKVKKAVNLSEIAESVEYVRLELNKDAVLCGNPSILLTSKYIFVRCGTVFQFGRDGKFICKVGSQGKGPKEYIYASHVSVNEKAEQVVVQSSNKISIYGFNGTFIREIPLKAGVYWRIHSLNNGDYIAWTNVANGGEENVFTLLNPEAKELQGIKNHLKWSPRETVYSMGWSTYNEFYESKGKVYLKDMYTDTIYTLNEKSRIVPAMYLDLGKYKIPDNKRPSFITDRKQVNNIMKGYLWGNVVESDKYRLMNAEGYSDEKKLLIMTDKAKNTSVLISDKGNKYAGFINDIDGGIDFWPRHIYADKWAYTIVPASDCIKYSTDNLKLGKKVKFPEKSKQLKTIIGSMNEEDNQVIVIVKMK